MSGAYMLFVAVLACLAVSDVAAISCYSCSSVTDSGCADPFESGNFETVSSVNGVDCAYCYKSDIENLVTKSCLTDLTSTTVANGDCDKVEVLGIENISCVCDSDNCNGAGMLAGSLLSVLAMALMKYLW